jgi:hypothetical protein
MGLPVLPLILAAAVQWLDPSAVTPGQQGVCVTEWSGGQRREIRVEVEGILDATGPDRTAVLIRLLDDGLKDSGVAAGMSGSPVYIDGKLLGAVAFGWQFAKEPLAGVTPFARMVRLAPGGPTVTAPAPALSQLAELAAGRLDPLAVLPPLPPRGTLAPQLAAVSGLPPADGFGERLLTRLGLQAVPAGAAADEREEGPPQAGGMLAVPLVWGDATLAAAGTVTARDGDKVYAFGHPLFGFGAVHMPAARARVLAVQDSYQNPFKLFSVGETFGTVVADRPAGLLAVAGQAPAGIPVTVAVEDPTGNATWRFHIVDEPLLATPLVVFLTHACLTARGAAVGESSVSLALTVHLADGRSVSVEQATRGTDALARIAAFAGGAVGVLANSSFPHPAIAGVTVHLRREEKARGAALVEAIPTRSTVAPGEALAVDVRLQPEHAPTEERRIVVRVPSDQPAGPLDLIVADGAAWSEYRLRVDGITPATFADQLAELAQLGSSATLVAALESRDRGVAVAGASQPDLPPSWAATLAAGLGKAGVTRLSTAVVAITTEAFPTPLEGAFRIPLQVRPRQEVP